MGVRLYFIWGLATSPLEWQPITPMQLCGLVTGSTSNLGDYINSPDITNTGWWCSNEEKYCRSLIRNHRFWHLEKPVMSSGYDSRADSPPSSGRLESPQERWHRERSHHFSGHFSHFGTVRKWNPQRHWVLPHDTHPRSLPVTSMKSWVGSAFQRKHYIRILKACGAKQQL